MFLDEVAVMFRDGLLGITGYYKMASRGIFRLLHLRTKTHTNEITVMLLDGLLGNYCRHELDGPLSYSTDCELPRYHSVMT